MLQLPVLLVVLLLLLLLALLVGLMMQPLLMAVNLLQLLVSHVSKDTSLL